MECGGGVFHVLSYHTCKTYNIPLLDRGIYVAQSGFSFGLQIPVSAVITSVAGRKVTSLQDFETALAGVPNKEMFEVRWFNPSANEHRQKCSMIRPGPGQGDPSRWQTKVSKDIEVEDG